MATGLEEFEESEIEKQFYAAAKYLETKVSEIDQTKLLQFYGLYKQSTIGPCNTPKPGMLSFQAKSKWNAWNELKEMPKNEAMSLYVEKLTELYPNCLNSSNKKESAWVSVSRPQIDSGDSSEDLAEADKTCFDYVKEGNSKRLIEQLESIGSTHPHLNELDDSGLGLIHWGADRGYSNVLEILLNHGADCNLVDVDGQTALHYAASCGHLECVKILLNAGVDKKIRDGDGQTGFDVASSKEIENLINA